ncbi:MAG: diaminopimelate dehydrogenase [Clostridiales bacterium]|nr:diaminopimelate dehydrogenase [Clostridiales bacterium]
MIKTVVFGYGNVGKSVVEACISSPDIKLVGIIDVSKVGQNVGDLVISSDWRTLGKIDVAILSLPSRIVLDVAKELLSAEINTVDSFDIHSKIVEVRGELNEVAKKSNCSAITAAGWDPGTDSIIRTILQAMAPKGITYTNFGPGMSMGHSVAAKAIDGVKDAVSMTIPVGTGIHRRMVYVELEEDASPSEVANAIKNDDYFSHDETHVVPVKSISDILNVGHGVHIERRGVSGITHNQLFEFSMKVNNPALTAQVLVSSARAVVRQNSGCYTLIEIPPVDFLNMSREEAVESLV